MYGPVGNLPCKLVPIYPALGASRSPINRPVQLFMELQVPKQCGNSLTVSHWITGAYGGDSVLPVPAWCLGAAGPTCLPAPGQQGRSCHRVVSEVQHLAAACTQPEWLPQGCDWSHHTGLVPLRYYLAVSSSRSHTGVDQTKRQVLKLMLYNVSKWLAVTGFLSSAV